MNQPTFNTAHWPEQPAHEAPYGIYHTTKWIMWNGDNLQQVKDFIGSSRFIRSLEGTLYHPKETEEQQSQDIIIFEFDLTIGEIVCRDSSHWCEIWTEPSLDKLKSYMAGLAKKYKDMKKGAIYLSKSRDIQEYLERMDRVHGGG